MSKEDITQRNVIELWASKYPEVLRWLTKIQRKDQNAQNLRRFCEYVSKTPPELLALKEKGGSTNPVEKLLDDFCGDTKADFANSARFNIAIAVKSFFKWNYAELHKACGIINLVKVKPYNPLTKDTLRQLYSRASSPRDRALVTFVTSTAVAKETLSRLKWSHLEADWQNIEIPCISIEPELLKGHGIGKYAGVKQITFLTPEAKRELLNYRGWMESKIGRKLTENDNIWLSAREPFEALGYKALGIHIGRLGKETNVKFSLHDGRRWLNTALEQIGISQNWAKKIRGRKVRGEEAPYSRPAIDQLRKKFAEAVPYLQFTSADTTAEDRLRKVEELTKTLTEDQKDTMAKLGIQLRTKATKTQQKCDGKNCQQLVSEEQLPELLTAGWKVVTTLPSGKIVISND